MQKLNVIGAKGIIVVEQDLRRMERKELARYFASGRSGRIVLAKLIRSSIWQTYEHIRAGLEPPVRGNLRTFWYRFIKPVLSHIPDDDQMRTDPYDMMLAAFSEMVLKHKLFRYADFDFMDENWENRRIGAQRPQILVFAEKSGWMRFLRQIHEELGVSILALGGAPSVLTSEYTAAHIAQATAETTAVELIAIVDYDPAGDIISGAFQQQLQALGVEIKPLGGIIHPRHYNAEELTIYRYPVPQPRSTKTRRWLERTGGINDTAYGLESESMPWERARQLVEEALTHKS